MIDENHNTLLISELQKLGSNERSWVIRNWLYQIKQKMPSEQFIKQVFDEVINVRNDRNPLLQYLNLSIRRFRDKVYALPQESDIDSNKQVCWPENQTELCLENNGILKIIQSASGIKAKHWQRAKQIHVAYRQGGEGLYLPGRKGCHKLKNLFQEASIPPWERTRIPLLYFDNRLVAVGEIWVADEFYGEQGECYQLQWRR
jgi:tRNA(Ile)-lysidine synthase